jgi:hypothetical protein
MLETVNNIKANGIKRLEKEKVLESNFGQMAPNTKECGLVASLREKVA